MGDDGIVGCRVTDNGRPSSNAREGRGSKIIGALAADLGGAVERRFESDGTTALLAFPQHIDG